LQAAAEVLSALGGLAEGAERENGRLLLRGPADSLKRNLSIDDGPKPQAGWDFGLKAISD
jgi:hypothetical protein